MTCLRSNRWARGALLVAADMWATAAFSEPAPFYFTDFQSGVGAEWSMDKTSTTPSGGRVFLGRVGRESVTLTLPEVPRHSVLTISFDVLIIGSWDGNYVSPTAGPDIWQVDFGEDDVVFTTTFNTHDFAAQYQAYPDGYPEGQHPSHTGAIEVGSLGYSCVGMCRDALYHIELIAPHSNRSIELRFSGVNLEDLSNESWGLDNVDIRMEGIPSDFNLDWYVDFVDYEGFVICMKGPQRPPGAFCPFDTDMDDDGDVDLADFQTVQLDFAGPDQYPR